MTIAIDQRLDADLRHCIELCQDCHADCTQTIAHCLRMGGEHTDPAHIALLQDCADLCRMTADSILRGSRHWNYAMGVCAFICERAAEDCERLGGEFMDECAATCRECHEECLRLSKERRSHDPMV